MKEYFGIFNNQLGGLICWIIWTKKQQEILCVQSFHNCWIVMDVKQLETWCVNSCSCNCWAKKSMKQRTFTFICCIVGTCFGGMQKAFDIDCCFRNCSCYCGDLSHCRSHCCSRCRKSLRCCDVIQIWVVIIVCLYSSRCCSCWSCDVIQSGVVIIVCLYSSRCCSCWDTKLLKMRRAIIWKLQEAWSCSCRAVVCYLNCLAWRLWAFLRSLYSQNKCIATCGMKEHNTHTKRNEWMNCSLIHFAKDSPFVIVTRWCLKVIGLINCENHCEDHCLSIREGHHQCPKDADNQVF